MTEQEAIEKIKRFKHFADLVESPEEYFQHMQGHEKELSLILNTFDVAEMSEMLIEALEKQMNDRWIPVTEKLPDCEKEVWIQTKRGTRTTAMYEDGKMSDDDSVWNWTDIDFDYDEKTDTNYIPEGWWEYRHFNQDDVYNCCVDEEVIVWKPLPEPYKGE